MDIAERNGSGINPGHGSTVSQLAAGTPPARNLAGTRFANLDGGGH
jgi:hypothetical protein